MDFDSIKSVLLGILSISVPALVAGLIYLSQKIVKFIDTKSNQLMTTTDNEKIQKYLNILKTNAITVVNSLNQVVVDNLKESSEDGKLTEEEIEMIGTTALNKMYSMTSDDVRNTLGTVYDDLDELFSNMIEEAVGKVKESK